MAFTKTLFRFYLKIIQKVKKYLKKDQDNTWDKFSTMMQYATLKLLLIVHKTSEPRIDFYFTPTNIDVVCIR